MRGKSFGTSGESAQAINVAVDASGNVVIYGTMTNSVSFGGPPVQGEFYVAKFSGSGAPVWSKGIIATYADSGSPWARALAVTLQGDVVIGGNGLYLDFGSGADAGMSTAFIAELSGTDGSYKWITGVDPAASAAAEVDGIAVDSAGNLLVGGESSGPVAARSPGSICTPPGCFSA
jgi:hypothetical protein